MNKIQYQVLNSYAIYTVNSNNTMSTNLESNVFHSSSFNVFVDDNSQINTLKESIVFKNDLIALNLINNKELLNCLTETVQIISSNGIYFHADLDLVDDDDDQKFILVYYPIVPKYNTDITDLDNRMNLKINQIYRTVLRNLYKYSISIRKNVTIDEQPI